MQHPNTGGSSGPEIDAIIDDPDGALIYVEAKWLAELGTGQGASPELRDDQIVLRRDAMRKNLPSGDHRPWVVLGLSVNQADKEVYAEFDPALRAVTIAWTTWDDLARCQAHPLADGFSRYLEWRKTHALTAPAPG